MEQNVKKKKGSLVREFRYTAVKIVAATAVTALLTVLAAGVLFYRSLYRDIYPSNYYEQQIPDLTAWVREQNDKLLSEEGARTLADRLGEGGILYLVADAQGKVIGKNMPFAPYGSAEELFRNYMNPGLSVYEGYYIRTVPLVQNDRTAGAVLFAYRLQPTFVSGRGRVVFALLMLALFSPFLYMVLFTLYFSERYTGKINRPLKLLSEAAVKIGERDLDFTIDYHADNELGMLCDAFAKMQEELKKSLSAQWDMEQKRTEMVAALAHDLKSPLSLIMVYVEALEEDYREDGGELSEYLSVIRENAEKGAALVRQMQITADLEQPGAGIQTEPVNIRAFLEGQVQAYRLQAEREQVEIQLAVSEEVPSLVDTDRERLVRILDNLISNSLQYTPAGGKITLSAEMRGDFIRYTVEDTGCGFDARDLKKAFDRFYRGDEARRTKGAHAGLGLFIVKQLAGQLGGDAEVGNTEAGGARVTFTCMMS